MTRLSRQMGVGDYRNFLAISLGAGDTTVMRITNAFATFANQGRALTPTLIDYIQDRRGRVIWRADTRPCEGCNAPDWDGRPMPRPPLRTRQVVDAMTAYQVVHMLEGVVLRGTATILRDLGRPIFGKTGTSTGPTNVWFIGGSAQVVAGVYIGFDQPRSLGGYAQGGTRRGADLPPVRARPPSKACRSSRSARRRASAWSRSTGAPGRRAFGVWPGTDPRAARDLGGVQAGKRAAAHRRDRRDRSQCPPRRRARRRPDGERPARKRLLAKSGRDLLTPRRKPFKGQTCAPKRKPPSTRSGRPSTCCAGSSTGTGR